MKKISEEIDLFTRLIKGIAAQFGDQCEVIIHDYDQPYEKTIVAIENGHVTGRKIGDCGTNLMLEVLKGASKAGDKYNYLTQTKDGKVLRSTTIYIRDGDEKVIGSICINFDITNFMLAEKTIQTITNNTTEEVNEVISNDVNEILDRLIKESLNYVGVPVAAMTREDKIKGLKYLEQKGALLIKKSGDKIARYYDISKYTLYNYLEQ